MIPLGKRIRELRLQKGWNQEVLAKGICEASMISQIENGRANPSPTTLRLIAEKLELPLHELTENVELGLADKHKFIFAKTLLNSGQPTSARRLLLELVDKPSMEVSIQQVRLTLAICYTQTDQYQDAQVLLLKLERSALLADDRMMLAHVSLVRAQVFMRQKEFAVSLYHLNQSLNDYNNLEVQDPHLYIEITRNIADVYLAEGLRDLACRIYHKLLAHQLDFLQLHEKAEIQCNLAQEYERTGDLQMAYKRMTHANHLYETLQDIENYEYSRSKILAMSVNEENFEENVDLLKNMAFDYESVGNHVRAGEVFVDLAGIYLKHFDYGQAEISSLDALGQFLQHASPIPAKGTAHRHLASCYFHKGQSDDGMLQLKEAIEEFQQHKLIAELDEAVTCLCSYLKKLGRIDEAFDQLLATKTFLMERLVIRRQIQDFGD